MERKSVQASLKLCCALSQLPSRYPLLNTATVCDRRCKHKRRTPNNTATGGSTVQVQAGCTYAKGGSSGSGVLGVRPI